jgi:uncharacterized membrane protein
VITVRVFVRKECELCSNVIMDLESLGKEFSLQISEIDIETDNAIREHFAIDIPVVEVGPYRLQAPISLQDLRIAIQAVKAGQSQTEKIGTKSTTIKNNNLNSFSKSEMVSYWISRHYLMILNIILIMYVGIPFLAPVFKKIKWDLAAEMIYRAYRPLCHQWAFRSFFMFGEQPFYPHEAAKISGVLTFEQVSGISDSNDPSRLYARKYEGNPQVGYKIALCERDIAIWGALALFGIIFAITRRKIPKVHWLIWLAIGLGPISLDGFSQLFSQLPVPFIQSILPYRESTPLLRVVTGLLFGAMTAWFIFPLIEESMSESRRAFAIKMASLSRK